METALYDETGQVISRPALTTFIQSGTYPISVKIPFGVRAAQTGIVQMDIRDPHGRMLSLISVHVLLLSEGATQVNPAGNMIYDHRLRSTRNTPRPPKYSSPASGS